LGGHDQPVVYANGKGFQMEYLRRLCTRLQIIVMAGVTLAVPSTALAQDSLSNPAAAQYDPQSQIAATAASGSDATGLNGSLGSLPFTGMDLIVVFGTALLLIAAGLVLRKLSAPPRPRI
jgi:hypothetical protein